jgi:hypothetical protein
MIAVPEATPVITPVEAFIVAIVVSLDVQVPPLTVAVYIVVLPTETDCTPDNVPADGAGFTVIENDSGAPLLPFKVGVTVITAVIGSLDVFNAVKEGIFPVPEDSNPIEIVLLVQV